MSDLIFEIFLNRLCIFHVLFLDTLYFNATLNTICSYYIFSLFTTAFEEN